MHFPYSYIFMHNTLSGLSIKSIVFMDFYTSIYKMAQGCEWVWEIMTENKLSDRKFTLYE